MINLLLGAPGGGKSYEAVAYHIIPALAEGRKVITNLPLNLECFPPEQRRLIDLRTETKAERPEVDWEKAESMFKRFGIAAKQKYFSNRAFSNVDDYGDDWRHPETGAGPLYVIDECHLALPRAGTPVAVAEWFSLHRHEFADVLLITQSYGKVQKDIIDLVQVCYRVRKASALGFSNRYIRKVFDGVRGECMNENVREYDKTYFKFYRSHTRSSSAGKELEAKDVKPIWKHWTFKGAALFLAIGIGIFVSTGAYNPMSNKMLEKKTAVTKRQVAPPVAAAEATPQPSASMSTAEGGPKVAQQKSSAAHPLAGFGLHVSGYMHNAKKALYMFTVSQNGQAIYNVNQMELAEAGYTFKRLNDCMVHVAYEGASFVSTCDAPRVGVNVAGTAPRARPADMVSENLPSKAQSVSSDGFGVLGVTGPGVRQPGA